MKTKQWNELVEEVNIVYRTIEDEDQGINKEDTISMVTGGIETIKLPIFTKDEIETMLKWGIEYQMERRPTEFGWNLQTRLISIIKEMEEE